MAGSGRGSLKRLLVTSGVHDVSLLVPDAAAADPFTATHFSFLISVSFLSLSVSSSDVILSSVSASAPVVVSDSEDDDDEVDSDTLL